MKMVVDMWKKLFSASNFLFSSLRERHRSLSSSIACYIFSLSKSLRACPFLGLYIASDALPP